jgi:glycerol-3-phosphate dehydrogenase
MNKSRLERKFPQLATKDIKYCSVFYEATHDDSRTNLAIAQTAAMEGATVVNYCEAVGFIKDDKDNKNLVTGAVVLDRETNEKFTVRAKSVLFCGGPFTDELRKMEDQDSKEAVTGASGIHIVLPSYYNSTGIGMVDMSTSDGRFLFFLPWNDHVLIGTTDHKCKPEARPVPDEAEIQWLLHEASKYISPELQLRRKDVISAWSGIRPLAVDPYAKSTASVSRDHVISCNPDTGVVFISGGKWTTFRQMAEEAVETAINFSPKLKRESKRFSESVTLGLHYIGYKGYTTNLPIRLIQTYGVSPAIAHRLSKAYGGRAHDVLRIAKEETTTDERLRKEGKIEERLLVKGFPVLEAEVTFAARYEWACHAEDFLSHRTRLAFVNRNAAISAIPRVVELMAQELGWDQATQEKELVRCLENMHQFGGPTPLTRELSSLRMGTLGDLLDAFNLMDKTNRGYLLPDELVLFAEVMNYHLSPAEMEDCVSFCMTEGKTRGEKKIFFDPLFAWWNSDRQNSGLREMQKKMANPSNTPGSGTMFG